MPLVTFAVDHFNCISCKLSRKYPEVIYEGQPLYYEKIGRNKIFSTFRVIIRYPRKDIFKKYFNELKEYKMVDDIRLLKQTETTFEYFSDFTSPIKHNIFYTLWKHRIVLNSNVKIVNGEEFFDAEIPENLLQTIIKDLEKNGKVRIVKRIEDKKDKKILTEVELNSLKLAKRFGYYREKRNITLDELAEKCNISRTGFRNNLRRAERKLFSKIIDDYV